MEAIYLDNAATTPMDPEVVRVMQESMLVNYGNPSSIHQFGRKAKVAVETARKNIAKYFKVSSGELVFTSGGTEANNWVLFNAVENLGVKRIITSKIEHHAVLHVVEKLQLKFDVEVVYVDLDTSGEVDLQHLEAVLSGGSSVTLVSLMMINNEIGNILPVAEVSLLCKKYSAFFHSDTVQVVGHYFIDLEKVPVDFITASAHKFHGPKGVGFVCFKNSNVFKPILFGGGQEKGLRSGTENVHAILGMEKALEIAYGNLDKDFSYVSSLKEYFIRGLQKNFPDISFNGLSSDLKRSSCVVLSVRFPVKKEMLLFNMDLVNVAVSSGSACSSGAQKDSHVLKTIMPHTYAKGSSLRFSFSRMNSLGELKAVLERLNVVF